MPKKIITKKKVTKRGVIATPLTKGVQPPVLLHGSHCEKRFGRRSCVVDDLAEDGIFLLKPYRVNRSGFVIYLTVGDADALREGEAVRPIEVIDALHHLEAMEKGDLEITEHVQNRDEKEAWASAGRVFGLLAKACELHGATATSPASSPEPTKTKKAKKK